MLKLQHVGISLGRQSLRWFSRSAANVELPQQYHAGEEYPGDANCLDI